MTDSLSHEESAIAYDLISSGMQSITSGLTTEYYRALGSQEESFGSGTTKDLYLSQLKDMMEAYSSALPALGKLYSRSDYANLKGSEPSSSSPQSTSSTSSERT